MSWIIKIRHLTWKRVLIALLGTSLLFSSGCALLWLGAGGTGGYLIRKGEEGDSSKKRDRTDSESKSSSFY
jgi:hypothetical protein